MGLLIVTLEYAGIHYMGKYEIEKKHYVGFKLGTNSSVSATADTRGLRVSIPLKVSQHVI